MSTPLFRSRLDLYTDAVFQKFYVLRNCVAFIDGTVIGISRPSGDMKQRILYNGHKRKHSLKFQAVTSPDGIIAHIFGPIEGRWHEWTMYVRSFLDDILLEVLSVTGIQCFLYGHSGYNKRWLL